MVDITGPAWQFSSSGRFRICRTAQPRDKEGKRQSKHQKLHREARQVTIKVERDTMTLIGIGNLWNEVWKRLN
jgi:hypothetical protein